MPASTCCRIFVSTSTMLSATGINLFDIPNVLKRRFSKETAGNTSLVMLTVKGLNQSEGEEAIDIGRYGLGRKLRAAIISSSLNKSSFSKRRY